MTELHRRADHFYPFEVMACEGWSELSQRGEKTTLMGSCEKVFRFLASDLWISVHQSLHRPKPFLPHSCYLPVAVVNSSEVALHPHTSLHISVTLCDGGLVPAVPSSRGNLRLFSSAVHHSIHRTHRAFVTVAPS